MNSDIITERNTTHGDFQHNAVISQDIKAILHSCAGWELLSYKQKESLDLIALKISRIMSGNADYADHWDDIIGYARLAKGDQPHSYSSIENNGAQNQWPSKPTPQSGSPTRVKRTSSQQKTKKRR